MIPGEELMGENRTYRPAATFELDWDAQHKHWKLIYRWRAGSRVLVRWRKIESRVPLDELGVDLIADRIAAEIESWLF